MAKSARLLGNASARTRSINTTNEVAIGADKILDRLLITNPSGGALTLTVREGTVVAHVYSVPAAGHVNSEWNAHFAGTLSIQASGTALDTTVLYK